MVGTPGNQEVKEGTPEPKRVGPNIDNFDLSDHAAVAVVGDESAWTEEQGGEFGGEVGGDFMQVVNKKGARGGGMPGPPGKERERRPADGRMGDGRGYRGAPPPDLFDKKMSKTAYDRRQSKLPPRLAKQREVRRGAVVVVVWWWWWWWWCSGVV